MTLNEIFAQYTAGSQGFILAVESNCGFDLSRTEIERIGNRATSADEFEAIWRDSDWWTDGNQEAS